MCGFVVYAKFNSAANIAMARICIKYVCYVCIRLNILYFVEVVNVIKSDDARVVTSDKCVIK